MIEATRFIVTGHVQGVGFRWAACCQARRLSVRGWVRNLSDGSIECLAMGKPSQVLKFTEWLWRGPEESKVENVKTTIEKCQSCLEKFCIR